MDLGLSECTEWSSNNSLTLANSISSSYVGKKNQNEAQSDTPEMLFPNTDCAEGWDAFFSTAAPQHWSSAQRPDAPVTVDSLSSQGELLATDLHYIFIVVT